MSKYISATYLSVAINIILAFLICSCAGQRMTFLEEKIVVFEKYQELRLMYVNAASWSYDSKQLAISGYDTEDNKFDNLFMYSNNKFGFSWSNISIGGGSVDFHPKNQVIAISYFEGIEYFNAFTGEKIRQIEHDFNLTGNTCIGRDKIKFTLDGSKIITLDVAWDSRITNIHIWDAKNDKCLETLVESGTSFDFKISNDGQYLTIGFPNSLSDDAGILEPQVHIWDVESRELICKMEGTPPIAFSQDGVVLASGNITDEGKVDIWDAKTCSFLFSLSRQENKIPFSMDFSPDGSLLAVGGSENFEIWDVANQKLLFVSERLPNSVSILLFSPDGKYLLTKTDRISTEDKAIITLWSIDE